jgi:hypothetical protein
MATKKKSKKKGTSRRRRRVGAMALNPANPLVKLVPIGIGYFFGDKINTPIMNAIGDKLDPKIIGIGEAGIGAYLTFFDKKPSLIKVAFGGLLLGMGAKKTLSEFGIGSFVSVGGYGQIPVIGRSRMNGYGDIPVIGSNIRRMGAYAPNGSVGAYAPNGSVGSGSKIMNGVDAGGTV